MSMTEVLLENNITFCKKDAQRIFDKLSRFYNANDVSKWSDKVCIDINELLSKYMVYDYEINPNSYMGIILACKSEVYGELIIKIVPPMIERFEKEISTLNLLPSKLTCRFYEIDYTKKAMVMERITPGTLVEFYDNKDLLAKLFKELSNNKTIPDDRIDERIKDFSEVVKKDYLISKSVSHEFFEQVEVLYDEFLKSYDNITINCKKYLLHGDVYKNNLLLSKNGIKLIDPLGFIAPFVMELVSICAYECYYNTDKSNKKILKDFCEFFKEYADETTYKEALFCQLVKVFIPSIFEANDGGIRANKWLSIIKELYSEKLS